MVWSFLPVYSQPCRRQIEQLENCKAGKSDNIGKIILCDLSCVLLEGLYRSPSLKWEKLGTPCILVGKCATDVAFNLRESLPDGQVMSQLLLAKHATPYRLAWYRRTIPKPTLSASFHPYLLFLLPVRSFLLFFLFSFFAVGIGRSVREVVDEAAATTSA